MHGTISSYIAIGIKTVLTYTRARVQLSTKNINSIGTLSARIAITTAELLASLLVECNCQFIRVKEEQASERVEKTTIHIVKTLLLSS